MNVAEIAAEAVQPRTREGSDIRVEIADDLLVSADPDLLTRALANSAQRHPPRRQLRPDHDRRSSRRGEEIAITVADSGPGVPEAELPHIFDAFYRVDASRTRDTGGTGLGLAIVKTCVESCCGTVTARNRKPHGLEVTITLHAAATLSPDLSTAFRGSLQGV